MDGHTHTYLTVSEAANYARTPEATLNTLRTRGGGPVFLKRGRRVLYRRADLDEWLCGGLCSSTSDPSHNIGSKHQTRKRPQRAATPSKSKDRS